MLEYFITDESHNIKDNIKKKNDLQKKKFY